MPPIVINRGPHAHRDEVFASEIQVIANFKIVRINVAFVSAERFAVEPDIGIVIRGAELQTQALAFHRNRHAKALAIPPLFEADPFRLVRIVGRVFQNLRVDRAGHLNGLPVGIVCRDFKQSLFFAVALFRMAKLPGSVERKLNDTRLSSIRGLVSHRSLFNTVDSRFRSWRVGG